MPTMFHSMLRKESARLSDDENHPVNRFVELLHDFKFQDILCTLLLKSHPTNTEPHRLCYSSVLEGVKRTTMIYSVLSHVTEVNRLKNVHNGLYNDLIDHPKTFESNNDKYIEFLVNTLKKILKVYPPKSLFERKKLWDMLTMSCQMLPNTKLHELCVPFELIQMKPNNGGEVISLLKWLLERSFADEDESLRNYCAENIGPFLLSNKCKILQSLYDNNIDDRNIVESLYRDIDDLLAKHCGVIQSAFSFTLRSTSHSIYTNNSTWSAENDEEMVDKFSRLLSSIKFISSICQCADKSSIIEKSIVEKGVVRLVRIWSTIPDDSFDISLTSRSLNERVCSSAFYELLRLNFLGIFTQRMVDLSDVSFMPTLFGELLSQGIIQEKIHGRNASNEKKNYEVVTKMIQAFFLQHHSAFDEYDNVVSTLAYVDKILPNVITGLVLGQDIETLFACTGFRICLLKELKRLKKISKNYPNEQIIGSSNFKLRNVQVKQSYNMKDLSKHTAVLCRTDDGVKILSKLLPALLMEPDRAPLLFYLKIVLQSQVSLKDLMKAKELKIIEELFWELGGEELDMDSEEMISSPQSWLLANTESHVVQGMKKGAIVMKQDNDAIDAQNEGEESVKNEGLISIDFNKGPIEQSTILESWIQKHFMMLLVKCVTIRWKRGRIEAKMRALKCLKILICFVKIAESTQYVTQILTMIDSVMNFEPDSTDNLLTKSKLQLIAVQCLANFVRVLVLHQYETIGQNLCKVIVSVFPLFDEEKDKKYSNTKNLNPFSEQAKNCVVDMLEFLTEGENGKNLFPFFAELPFLPPHPKLNHIREALKRYGINFEKISEVVAIDCSEETTQFRDTLTSTSVSSHNIVPSLSSKMEGILRRRLHSLKRLFNHENENVRKLVLKYSISIISENRELFYSLVKTEDASLQFLTVRSTQDDRTDNDDKAFDGKYQHYIYYSHHEWVSNTIDDLMHAYK